MYNNNKQNYNNDNNDNNDNSDNNIIQIYACKFLYFYINKSFTLPLILLACLEIFAKNNATSASSLRAL